MTREETKKHFKSWCQRHIGNTASNEDYHMFNNIMALLEQEPCEDAVSRKEVRDTIFRECSVENLNIDFAKVLLLQRKIKALQPVQSKPKTGYISIDDAMSVFDDFMCGEVDENGTETFLEMLKDKTESEG